MGKSRKFLDKICLSRFSDDPIDRGFDSNYEIAWFIQNRIVKVHTVPPQLISQDMITRLFGKENYAKLY